MSDRNYGALRSADKFEAFVNKLIAQGKPVGFDIEASYSAAHYIEKGALLQFHPTWFLVGFSFTNSTEWARYVPIAHADGNNVDDVLRTARALWRLLTHKDADGNGLIVAHNLPYEIKGCRRWFIDVLWDDPEVGEEVRAADGFFEGLADSMIEVWLAAEYEPVRAGVTTKDLKGITKMAFGHQMVHFDDLFKVDGKKASKDKRFHLLSILDATNVNYACEDALWCLALHTKHIDALKDTLIFRTEMALIPVLIHMEVEGMYLDWNEITKRAAEIFAFRDFASEEILQELSRRLGRMVTTNLASPAQLSKVLYDPEEGLGLPIKKRTDTGAASTDEEALRGLAKKDPVIKKILEWKEISKLYGSYLNKYATTLNYGGTGRAYPNHNQAGALTGRLSVDHVSYQQWPKPYHYELKSGKKFDLNFRDLLTSPEGFRIIGYDFSQVELRVLAGMANETALLKAFSDGIDIHKATASNMFGIPLEAVTKKIRAQGKTLNFAVVYGSGAGNIAELLTSPEAPVSTEDAEELLEKYFTAFPGLRNWMDAKVAEGREQGFVHTMFGRKFTVWEYKDHRDWIRKKGDRMCVNAPVQGGAADYMKIGMVRVAKAIKKAEESGQIPVGGVRLIMTVHDALEFYVHDDVATQTVIDIVGPAVSFPVKGLPEIRADWHEGLKWGSVVEITLDGNKKISGFALEDVDEIFPTIELAYAHQAKLAGHDIVVVPEKAVEVPAQAVKTESRRKLLGGSTNLMDLEVDTPVVAVVDDSEPEWLHGPEWHAEHGTPMALETQRVLITMTEQPDEDQWDAFEKLLKANPGPDTVVVLMPDGELELDSKHSLSKADQPQISLILGGASLVVSVETVDSDLMTVGIEL